MMPQSEGRPRIIANPLSTETPSEGQCDACPRGPTLLPLSGMDCFPGTARFRSSPLQTVPLGEGFSTVYGPGLRNGPVILNCDAASFLDHFETPRTLDDIPLSWLKAWGRDLVQDTVRQMITLGLLVQEESDDR